MGEWESGEMVKERLNGGCSGMVVVVGWWLWWNGGCGGMVIVVGWWLWLDGSHWYSGC